MLFALCVFLCVCVCVCVCECIRQEMPLDDDDLSLSLSSCRTNHIRLSYLLSFFSEFLCLCLCLCLFVSTCLFLLLLPPTCPPCRSICLVCPSALSSGAHPPEMSMDRWHICRHKPASWSREQDWRGHMAAAVAYPISEYPPICCCCWSCTVCLSRPCLVGHARRTGDHMHGAHLAAWACPAHLWRRPRDA